ncbi:MAG TPA: hypothetical protein ENI96_06140, partial [Sedimenticola thiotaurini]|nr:hypothetical protein [Sedimenticola thiotaurini]
SGNSIEEIDAAGGHIEGTYQNQSLDFSQTRLTDVDEIRGGGGRDTITGSAGDDVIHGDSGNDRLDGGAGDDLLSGGSGNDAAFGGEGNDTYLFDPFDGVDTFDGGSGGWTDAVQLDADADPAADPDNPWTIEINGEVVEYDLAAHALELDPDTSGVITLDDGSQLVFDGVERIEW